MRWAAALAPALALALAVATYPQAASASSSSFMDDVQSPLPGTERGSPESYVRNFESVFAEELLEALLRELAPLDTMGNTETRLPFGKRQTFWTALNEPPRFAAERAVKLLQELTFPAALGGPEAFGIVGCKYWVQARGSDSDVDFHYDKDEGLASEMQKMKLPPLVGVTHLEDFGAPTVVLNQSTTRNGNLDAPTLPSSGWLVYPKRNKHCLHRGDLHHGAPQDMAAAPVPHDAKRHSFITSWEVKKPLEPNCRRVTDAELQDKLAPHSLFPPGSPQWSDFSGLSDALAEVAPQRMDWSQEAAVVRRRVQLPLGEVAHLDVLREPESGVTYWVDWSGGDRSADSTDDDGATTGGTFDDGLGPGLSFMGVFEMDLKDQLQMKHIYHSHSPVAMVFYTGEGQFKQAEGLANAVTRQLLLRGEIGEPPPLETFLVDTETCGDVMRAFRVSAAETPIAAVGRFGTTPYMNDKWVMRPEDLPFTAPSFFSFVDSVLSSAREPSGDLKADAEARAASRDR